MANSFGRFTRPRALFALCTGLIAVGLAVAYKRGVRVMGATTLAEAQPAQGKKPNVVFFLVDNVGLSDFGVYGGTIPTPRIDKLAAEGIRFNNYNVEVQCTPSRSAIHTGRHPVRSGTYKVPLPGQGKAGLVPWEYTVAELLSDAGYATAVRQMALG